MPGSEISIDPYQPHLHLEGIYRAPALFLFRHARRFCALPAAALRSYPHSR